VTNPRTPARRPRSAARSETGRKPVSSVPAGQHPGPVVVSLHARRSGTAAETASETAAGTAPARHRGRGRPPAPARSVIVVAPDTVPLNGAQRQQAITVLAALIRQCAGTSETNGETTRKAA
jgi:hypothetical protein